LRRKRRSQLPRIARDRGDFISRLAASGSREISPVCSPTLQRAGLQGCDRRCGSWFPTAPLAFGLRRAGGSTVENPERSLASGTASASSVKTPRLPSVAGITRTQGSASQEFLIQIGSPVADLHGMRGHSSTHPVCEFAWHVGCSVRAAAADQHTLQWLTCWTAEQIPPRKNDVGCVKEPHPQADRNNVY